jgi:hypothetical protein
MEEDDLIVPFPIELARSPGGWESGGFPKALPVRH